METNLQPNSGKNLTINVQGKEYARYPVKTHVIQIGDKIAEVVEKYVAPHWQEGDMVFISEKIVAISQGRSFPIDSIKPSPLAKLLVKFVHKSKYGIGLGSPWTMELAIREAGAFRMLLAAFASAVTKPFGIKGVFYKVVGNNINAIDGPCDYTLPPYNKYAKLGPAKPHEVAKDLKKRFNHEFVIIDANDLGAVILGKSDKELADEFLTALFKDNPLGQSSEQTPMAIIREQK